jgi:hypothetical protein
MQRFFLKCAQHAKRVGDAHERIHTMQQLASASDWSCKDFSRFGHPMSIAEFKSEYDTSLYTVDPTCTDVILYPQMYYIQLMAHERWMYHGLFRDAHFSHHLLESVEEYMYEDVVKSEKHLT